MTMGTWGYEPRDNDGTGDLMAEVDRKHSIVGLKDLYSKEVRGRHNIYHRYERVGVVQTVLERGGAVTPAILKMVVRDLDTCLSDDEWVASWREPKQAEETILAFRAAVVKLLEGWGKQEAAGKTFRARMLKAGGRPPRRKVRGPPMIYADPGWPHLDALRKKALRSRSRRAGRKLGR